MNGLFGNIQMNHGQPVAPDVAAAMGPGMSANVAPPPQQEAQAAPADPNAMSADQQALNAWLAQQEQAKQQQATQPAPKYSVGDPHLDKYINMFIGN